MTRRNPARKKKHPTTLAECSGQEQVAKELERGNTSIQTDVDEKLEELSRRLQRGGGSWEARELDPWWQDDYVREQIVKEVATELPPEVSESEIDGAVRFRLPNGPRDQNSKFKLEEHSYRRAGGRGANHSVATVPQESEFYFWLEDDEGKIPNALVKAVLVDHHSEMDGHEWYEHEGGARGEPATTSAWSITQSDSDYHVNINEDDWDEMLQDIRSSHFSDLFDRDPVAAKKAFIEQIKERLPAVVYERLMRLAPQIPDEEWGNFCTKFWSSDESEQSEVESDIEEFLDLLESPPLAETDPARVVGVVEWVARKALDQLRDEDRPPWTVIRLTPGDLSREGTSLRHCIGRPEMGYVRALKNGEIEVWSVRSPSGRPIFTMEVDAEMINMDDERWLRKYAERAKPGEINDERSQAFKQIRGKVNRLPGFADIHASGGLKWPNEVKRLARFFDQIGIDPNGVNDLGPGLEAIEAAARGERADPAYDASVAWREGPLGNPAGFDQPYRRA